MSAFFLKIVNMSIAASWLVLAVLLLRLVLKKAPKWVRVLLWGFVAVRLICPFSFESMLSLIPSAETVSPEIMMDWTPEISTGINSLDTVVNPIITETFAPDPISSMNPLQLWIPLAAIVWLVGIAAMLIYTTISYILLRRKVATAVLLKNNIYQSENVDSPFVLGIVRPKIYLPFQMDGQNLAYVIAHEESHIRRKDHWWKPLGFLLLTLHWFNPLLWLGYIFLCRDIELACDEKVIKEMDRETKANYTAALVACSVSRRSIAACPLAFGEIGVKERVKSVMHYKKPAFWIVIAAIVTCVVVAVCFLTDPLSDSDTPENYYAAFSPDPSDIDAEIVNTFSTDLKTYYELSDGTWRADGINYRYRLEISGRMHNAAVDSTFVYLSNIESISFDQAWLAAGLSSNTADYFNVEEAVLVDWISSEDTASTSPVGGEDGYANGSISGDNTFIIATDTLEKAVAIAILDQNSTDRFQEIRTGLISAEAHQLLGLASKSGTPLAGQTNHVTEITVYVQYVYHRYSLIDGELNSIAAIATPAVITFRGDSATGYKLQEFREPNGGNTYADEVRSLFPEDIADILLDPQNDVIDMEKLESDCLAKAKRTANWRG